MEQEQFYSRRELAELFKVKLDTVKKWEERKLITPSFHVNNRPRYSKSTIEALMQKQPKSEPVKITVNA